MKEIGKLLKEKRKTGGLSLKAAHKSTKIQEQYLVALEEGNMKVFSAEIYYKSFLKSYAKYLGFDPELILKQYEEKKSSDVAHQYSYERDDSFFSKDDKEDNAQDDKKVKDGSVETKWLVAVLVVIAVLFIVFLYFNKNISEIADGNQSLPDQFPAQPQQTEEVPVLASAVLIEVSSDTLMSDKKDSAEEALNIKASKQPAAPAAPVAKTAKQSVDSAKKNAELELRIEAVENVWVKIESDSRELYQGTVLKGSSKNFKASDKFSLQIGYAPGIKVFLNENQIDVVSGSVQDVNNILLTRDDL
ncbi:MAG: DUF4115 domain-containing protein [Endomicrobium sp.]|jgi:cytoskeletal protein RodZ|nr:DUF4115 domain-containing protein [Endomicrobium sp.]